MPFATMLAHFAMVLFYDMDHPREYIVYMFYFGNEGSREQFVKSMTEARGCSFFLHIVPFNSYI